MFYESITQSFIDEYGSLSLNSKQTTETIKNAFSFLNSYFSAEEIFALDNDLFCRSNNNDAVQISGERNIKANLFKLPTFIESKQLGLSDIDLLEAVLRFIHLYDYKQRDYKRKILPLLIIFICLKAKHFIGCSSVSYKNGLFSISFSSSVPFLKGEVIDLLKKNIKFVFFENINLIRLDQVSASFSELYHADTADGYWHSYMLLLDEDEQKTCISKVRFWLSYCGELSRKELEEITKHQYSERTINDAIHKLISNCEIEVVGNANSPSVKYKFIAQDQKYL